MFESFFNGNNISGYFFDLNFSEILGEIPEHLSKLDSITISILRGLSKLSKQDVLKNLVILSIYHQKYQEDQHTQFTTVEEDALLDLCRLMVEAGLDTAFISTLYNIPGGIVVDHLGLKKRKISITDGMGRIGQWLTKTTRSGWKTTRELFESANESVDIFDKAIYYISGSMTGVVSTALSIPVLMGHFPVELTKEFTKERETRAYIARKLGEFSSNSLLIKRYVAFRIAENAALLYNQGNDSKEVIICLVDYAKKVERIERSKEEDHLSKWIQIEILPKKSLYT